MPYDLYYHFMPDPTFDISTLLLQTVLLMHDWFVKLRAQIQPALQTATQHCDRLYQSRMHRTATNLLLYGLLVQSNCTPTPQGG